MNRGPGDAEADRGDVESAPTLSDGVVRLNAFRPEDARAHVSLEDDEIARRFGWWPKRSTEETTARAIAEWNSSWESSGPTRAFAVRDVKSGALLGNCELRIKDDGVAHISYATASHARRRGIATRAVKLVCAWAFAELAMSRIEAYVELDNVASRAVARHAGFVEEGLRQYEGRDMMCCVKRLA